MPIVEGKDGLTKKRLRLIVRVIDKKLWEENGKKPTRNDVEIELLIDSKM